MGGEELVAELSGCCVAGGLWKDVVMTMCASTNGGKRKEKKEKHCCWHYFYRTDETDKAWVHYSGLMGANGVKKWNAFEGGK